MGDVENEEMREEEMQLKDPGLEVGMSLLIGLNSSKTEGLDAVEVTTLFLFPITSIFYLLFHYHKSSV